ncbi:hypothetical protein V5740_11770 [Croceibacterium sp. TMG7-5b_MA50]|uniref:hypothetical protein n=1 Tax=Croceibacterium sp. TMG7-5b_MA50 TaxID=3121290 RepID=UPI00322216A7
MSRRSPLDDPHNAAHAWRRFRRLMWVMLGITIAVVIIAMLILWHEGALVSVHFFIASALGIGLTMLLMSALMGLVFLSNGTGHDHSISHRPDRGDDEEL